MVSICCLVLLLVAFSCQAQVYCVFISVSTVQATSYFEMPNFVDFYIRSYLNKVFTNRHKTLNFQENGDCEMATVKEMLYEQQSLIAKQQTQIEKFTDKVEAQEHTIETLTQRIESLEKTKTMKTDRPTVQGLL